MRVAVVTIGSRGDVQPCVALAVGLRRAGHDVRLAAPATFADLAARHDVAFDGLPVDPAALLAGDVGQAWIESGRNPVAFLRGLRAIADPVEERVADAILATCADADLVVYTTLAFPAWHVASVRGIPAIQVSFAPLTPTAAFPPVLVPSPFASGDPWRPTLTGALARTYHRGAHRLFAQALWLPLRRRVNRWRATRLDAAPCGLRSPALDVDRRGEPLLHAFSPTILPPPPDWGPHVFTTGAWFLEDDEDEGWTPPDRVARFMGAGPPPVVVGMGSMTARDPAELTAAVLGALHRSGHRGVLLSGWSRLGEVSAGSTEQVLVCDELPHAWIMPRASAAVHHGGAGTTAASLRAGIPTVVVPHFGDQALWGDRVHALGAGPVPIPRGALTAERLAVAIARAVADPAMRNAARRVGDRIRAERGLQRAVQVVDRVAATVGQTPRGAAPRRTDTDRRPGAPRG